MAKFLFRLIAVVGMLTAASLAHADYPDRPIRMVLPLPPGSATDTVARILAGSMERSMKQTFVVDNRPGGDGAIAGRLVAKSPADGYTLLFGTNSPMSVVPALNKQPGYDPVQDFTPISLVGQYSSFLWVNSASAFNTLQEMIQYARANPDKLSYATGNTGGMVAMAQMLSLTGGPKLVHVPYRGEPAALIDVISNRVQMMFATPTAAGGYAKEGKLRPLVTTLAQRSPAYPQVPTMGEAGVPGFSITLWGGIFAPAKLPPTITERLTREVNLALAQPEVRQQLERQQFFGQGSSSQELQRFTREQLDAYRRALREAGMQPE
jgi:tripartite-type tricarboxylate transporter receptor subunit TctC